MTIQTETIKMSMKDYLVKGIAKLNKKAVKLGCDLMKLSFDNPTVKEVTHSPNGVKLIVPYLIEYIDATLEYEIPMIEGWELIAKLDIYPAEGTDVVMISAVPDKEIPESYKNKNEIHCDHCGWNRNRHHSILLRHESGEYKEVGSTCVKDFFPAHDPRGLMLMASMDFESMVSGFKDEDEYNGYGRRILAYGLKEVLTYASGCIHKFGWCSKKKAYEMGMLSTSDRVWENLECDAEMKKNNPEDIITIAEEDTELAEKVIEYFKTLEIPEGNDYLSNCKNLTTMNYVPCKFMGFAVSMVSSYQREIYNAERNAEKEKMPDSSYIGEIGDRLKDVAVDILFSKNIETMYGDSTLYIFRDALGNVMKTFYSGSKWEFGKDDKVLITGTIKKHNEYQGKKETMLNRVFAKLTETAELISAAEFSA